MRSGSLRIKRHFNALSYLLPGAANLGGFLRFRFFQQPQPPVQRRVLLPAHENPHHARGGGAPAGLFQGTLSWIGQ